MADNPKVQPGDWVRFYRNGQLVLGIVAYVHKNPRYPHETVVSTDVGTTDADELLEVRRA